MQNDVARRVRAVGARLLSCPSRAWRVGDGCGLRGTGSAGHSRCPRGAQGRPRRPRWGGCESGGGLGG
eukprot:3112632-Prymnesium_polylepis.1